MYENILINPAPIKVKKKNEQTKPETRDGKT